MIPRIPDAPQRYPLTLKLFGCIAGAPQRLLERGQSRLNQRGASTAAGGVEGEGGREGTCNHPNNRFFSSFFFLTHFTPSGSVWQGKEKATRLGPLCIIKCISRLLTAPLLSSPSAARRSFTADTVRGGQTARKTPGGK